MNWLITKTRKKRPRHCARRTVPGAFPFPAIYFSLGKGRFISDTFRFTKPRKFDVFRGDVHWAAYAVHVSNNHRVVQCVFTIGKYFTVFATLDSGVGFLPYSRVTSRETGLITMIDLPFLWAYLTVFPVPLGHPFHTARI